jgi:putative SOS response-associated peptidase YedK
MVGWANELKEWPDIKPSFNRAPTTQVAAFRSPYGESMRWGMIPGWSNTFDSKYATFNARIETVAEKPTFRNAWAKSQRCLVPMAGYYEWVGSKGNKQAMYITDRNAGGLVTAGLYEPWGKEGQLSCTILTMPADNELGQVHPRMPIMLRPEAADAWLTGAGNVIEFQRPEVVFHPVSNAVGNVRNDQEELIQPTDI